MTIFSSLSLERSVHRQYPSPLSSRPSPVGQTAISSDRLWARSVLLKDGVRCSGWSQLKDKFSNEGRLVKFYFATTIFIIASCGIGLTLMLGDEAYTAIKNKWFAKGFTNLTEKYAIAQTQRPDHLSDNSVELVQLANRISILMNKFNSRSAFHIRKTATLIIDAELQTKGINDLGFRDMCCSAIEAKVHEINREMHE